MVAMRVLAVIGWSLVALLGVAYHYGPGQERLRIDDAANFVRQGDRYAANKQWDSAAASYDEALKLLPEDRQPEARRLRLERNKAQMLAKKLPEANLDLEALVEELKDGSDPQLLAQARAALANSQYYLTWLMRLEGLSRDEWEPVIEASRQHFRLLAEQSQSAGDADTARQHGEDLEATIRLARLDLSELQGLSLPSQCQGCCSGKGSCNSPKRGKSQTTAERKDARGASSGPPPDGSGN
jgi:hypothetical protein